MITAYQRDSRQRRRGALLAAAIALVVMTLSTACGPTSEPPAPGPATTSQSIVRLASELVGRWETKSQLDSSGSQAIVRTYRFAPDGRYDYTIGLCRSSTDCTIQASESGSAQAYGGMLALKPQTRRSDGPRTFPYVVGRDPDVGDLQLHLTLPDGEIDIFYGG